MIKRSLYESIMKNIDLEIGKALNEAKLSDKLFDFKSELDFKKYLYGFANKIIDEESFQKYIKRINKIIALLKDEMNNTIKVLYKRGQTSLGWNKTNFEFTITLYLAGSKYITGYREGSYGKKDHEENNIASSSIFVADMYTSTYDGRYDHFVLDSYKAMTDFCDRYSYKLIDDSLAVSNICGEIYKSLWKYIELYQKKQQRTIASKDTNAVNNKLKLYGFDEKNPKRWINKYLSKFMTSLLTPDKYGTYELFFDISNNWNAHIRRVAYNINKKQFFATIYVQNSDTDRSITVYLNDIINTTTYNYSNNGFSFTLKPAIIEKLVNTIYNNCKEMITSGE